MPKVLTNQWKLAWIVNGSILQTLPDDNTTWPRGVAIGKKKLLERTTHRAGTLVFMHASESVADLISRLNMHRGQLKIYHDPLTNKLLP